MVLFDKQSVVDIVFSCPKILINFLKQYRIQRSFMPDFSSVENHTGTEHLALSQFESHVKFFKKKPPFLEASVSDPDPHRMCIQFPPGSAFGMRIRIQEV
jgi:hypothetical protein